MSYNLRTKLKHLAHKCELTDKECERLIKALDAVEKHEETFERCTGCKEYDQEAHCCHRWTKCIRDTVENLKSQQAEGDLISREAMLDIIEFYHINPQHLSYYALHDDITDLPSVTLQPREAIDRAIEQIKATCFVDLQDGSEEWRSYVNETVLDVLDIIDKCLKEEHEK